MREYTISAATIEDIPALVKLVNSAYRGDGSKKGWTTEADLLGGIRVDEEALLTLIEEQYSVILKYEEEGNLLACVNLQQKHDELYLGMLTVSPELQGRGIGKILLKAAEVEALNRGMSAIIMTVISVRTELIAWYERHGYERTGEILPFPDDPRFGIPKQALRFETLRKEITQ